MGDFWIFDQRPPIPSDLSYFCPFILKISAKSLERFSRKIDFSRFWPFFDRKWLSLDPGDPSHRKKIKNSKKCFFWTQNGSIRKIEKKYFLVKNFFFGFFDFGTPFLTILGQKSPIFDFSTKNHLYHLICPIFVRLFWKFQQNP